MSASTKPNKTSAQSDSNASQSENVRHVFLDNPIMRGDTQITSLTIRKPMGGELRGLSLADLAKLDVNAVIKVLPRITLPSLTSAEVAAMPSEDIFSCACEVGSFFLTKKDLMDSPPA